MRRGIAVTAAIIMAGGMLVACATARPMPEPPGALPAPTETVTAGAEYGTGMSGPGPFVIRYDGTELHLAPVTYCYGNACVDGVDEDPPSVGSPDELLVFVPVAGFDSLHVGQVEGDDYCTGRSVEAEVVDLGDGWWSVRPRGEAADYRVDLFAGGEGSGDMAATLRWSTPADAPLPEPVASLALIADHDGEPDSYGLELTVGNLAAPPEEYAATITVTAANGASTTIEAEPVTDCLPPGSLSFDGPDDEALAASRLGDFPFTYEVTLTLDGETHHALAVFPDDVDVEHGVAVPLEFAPALP
ncbi:hypothetical protein [Microbacterium terricola]|uniref:Uncharacterized protein n=1 Tax=Microbacterium terricola TaxID=344163 RepID=A0ABM8DUY0_9MICO|nr:hypothetical protein [Microbacterium terricola]UYK39772.1 hypothetical protein OAU46_13910 [Microbacterium terricola]BDV29478.1 hypothetical protein Microterr_01380 [Microbacterium terricola]